MAKHLIIIIYFGLCLFLGVSVKAQISHGGQPLPLTATKSLTEDMFITMPPFDLAEQLRAGKPFVCPVDSEEISGEDVLVFSVPVRYGESRLAQHLMGYALEGEGVCGLESAYQQLLRQDTGTNQVVYQVNGQGELLAGSPAKVTPAEPVKTGGDHPGQGYSADMRGCGAADGAGRCGGNGCTQRGYPRHGKQTGF